MAWRFICALIASLFFGGCAQEFPIEFWIDNDYSDEQEKVILRAIGRWEKIINEHLGEKGFVYMGQFDDDLDFDDIDDGRHVIYKITDPQNETMLSLEELLFRYWDEEGFIGYGLHSDIFIDWNDIVWINGYQETLQSHDESEHYTIFLYFFEELIMHEVGHLLGLGHNIGPNSIMTPHAELNYPDPLHFYPKDIEAFCVIYHCPQ